MNDDNCEIIITEKKLDSSIFKSLSFNETRVFKKSLIRS